MARIVSTNAYLRRLYQGARFNCCVKSRSRDWSPAIEAHQRPSSDARRFFCCPHCAKRVLASSWRAVRGGVGPAGPRSGRPTRTVRHLDWSRRGGFPLLPRNPLCLAKQAHPLAPQSPVAALASQQTRSTRLPPPQRCWGFRSAICRAPHCSTRFRRKTNCGPSVRSSRCPTQCTVGYVCQDVLVDGCRQSRRIPTLRLSGEWLAELGFAPGSKPHIAIVDGDL